jgi:HD-GYP domain-containing protein (c-di-GMP phosphodiesterase class II)
MPIRTRLLVLLLALVLIPMALLGGYMLHSLDRLGERVGAEAHDALLDAELARLRAKVADAVVIYGRQTEALEYLIGDQATLAEAVLASTDGADVSDSRSPLSYASDFDAGRVPVSPSARHRRLAKDGATEPMSVSRDLVALHLAPGVSRDHIVGQAARLSKLAPDYARLSKLGDLGVLWHYTSLESGLHSAYPGHGGYPDTFDPRQRPWYREAMEKEGPIWSVPFVDVATRTVVSSVAQAIRSPEGRIIGVTGIDVSVPSVFHGFSAEVEGWDESGEAMIVRVYEDGRLEVRGHERPGAQPHAWETSLEHNRLRDPRGELAAAFAQARATGRPEILRHPHRGIDSLWAMAPILDRGAYLAVVVPVGTVIEAAEGLAGVVAESFRAQGMGLAIGMLCVALVVVALASWTADGFTRPLRLLSETASAIADGDLGSRAPVRRSDELGSLADSVNLMADSIEKLLEAQEEAYLQALKSLTQALQKKDVYTAGHSGRVKHYSLKLGERLELDDTTLDLLGRGALMHDIGKIGIPDAVLNKPAPLDRDEYHVMQQHPGFTAAIMRPLVRFRAFAEIAAWHHERWDGAGYPDGLSREEIPLLARIVAIADAWDAMTGDRIYRKGMPAETALRILEAEAESGQFEPDLIRLFIVMVREEIDAGGVDKAARGSRRGTSD